MTNSEVPPVLKTYLNGKIRDAIHDLLLSSFESWKSKGCPAYSQSENDITQMIFEEMKFVLAHEGKSPMLLPVVEHIEPDEEIRTGRKSASRSKRVDVAVYWELNAESRYRIECKRIGTSNLAKEYVSNGIGRFMRNEYAQNQNESTMLGYIQNSMSHKDSLDSINHEVSPVGGQHLRIVCQPSDDTQVHSSEHPRDNNGPITLTHIFLRFKVSLPSKAH